MGRNCSLIVKDIYLDEDAFQIAADEYAKLAEDMKNLRQKISGLLDGLREGFDTPAGKVFFEACGSNLLQPLDDQLRVLQHVSDNLRNAKQKYQSVFDEYKLLKNAFDEA